MQVQDFALAGKEVVFDVEPVHRLKMAAEHGDGDQIGDRGGFIAAFFDGVQGLQRRICMFCLSCSYHCETRA